MNVFMEYIFPMLSHLPFILLLLSWLAESFTLIVPWVQRETPVDFWNLLGVSAFPCLTRSVSHLCPFCLRQQEWERTGQGGKTILVCTYMCESCDLCFYLSFVGGVGGGFIQMTHAFRQQYWSTQYSVIRSKEVCYCMLESLHQPI